MGGWPRRHPAVKVGGRVSCSYVPVRGKCRYCSAGNPPTLWHEGHSKLTELITTKYGLDEINEGCEDLMDGKNIRGVIVHQH